MDVSFSCFRKVFAFFVFSFCCLGLYCIDVPDWKGPVLDMANVISAQEESELTEYLVALNNQTGVQMAVLTVDSLDGTEIEDFSIKVAEKWALGQEKEDNGALLVVSVGDRQLRIETGYGLESLLTDAKCGLIIRNVITPHFRDGNYGEGILAGIKNMAGVATENAQLVDGSVSSGTSSSNKDSIVIALFFFAVFVMIVTAGITSSVKRGKSGNRTVFMPNTNFGGSTFGGNRSGFGGGGFSGGGGGFGGGGASGGW